MELVTATSTDDAPKTHKQEMLALLHKADIWHEQQVKVRINKKKKMLHRDFQRAIWWAIQNLDDEFVEINN